MIRPTRRAAVLVFVCGVATIVAGAGGAFTATLLLLLIGAGVVDALLLRRARPTGTRQLPATVALLVTSPFSLELSTDGPAEIRRLSQPSPPEIRLIPDENGGSAVSYTHLTLPTILRV